MSGTDETLTAIIERTLELCRAAGASSAEVSAGSGQGLVVSVRMGELERLEHERDKGMRVTVYAGRRKGSASSTDFSDKALQNTVRAAMAIANNAGADDCAGLIDPDYIAKECPELDLYHPWDLSPEAAGELALRCEDAAREHDGRINNSDGASLSAYAGSHAYGNSHGFIGGWDWSNHAIDCTVIAEQNGNMQRDGWYSRARDKNDLEDVAAVGRTAAARTVARLGARKLSTRNVPVIFAAPVAGSLFSAFIGAISGGALYRRASFLLDRLGEEVFAKHINIHEQPHIPKGIGSAAFDADGMATRPKPLVKDGVLQSYLLSAYSARKLALPPTGNAGGVHNLIVESGAEDLPALLKLMGRGLLITELIGFGVNQVTGDYSRGATGFWIEDGERQFPVEEITVAGNLLEMYQKMVAVASDVECQRNIQTGSVLIENMAVAGE